MDLFVVKRYLGEEEETNVPNHNRDHFANLISKIEERKKIKTRKTSLTNNNDNSFNSDTILSHSEKNKSRKRKQVFEQNDSNISTSQSEIEVKSSLDINGDAKQSKKHRRDKDIDKNGNVDSETNSFISTTENNEITNKETTTVKLKKHKMRSDLKMDISNVLNNQDKIENESNIKGQTNEIVTERNGFINTKHNEELDSNVGKKMKKKKRKKEENISRVEESADIFKSLEENEATNLQEMDESISPNDPNGNFIVIGDHSFNKNKEVKRVLPQWLTKPSVISVDLKHLTNDIHSIPDLNKILIRKLEENGITHFFPVQSQLIPFLLKSERTHCSHIWPVDVCVSAPTGSGKTLAFVLPIIQTLMTRSTSELRAIVILPVQDLAAQVASVFKKYVKGTGLSVYLTTGGTALYEEQQHLVKQKADGTFERLVDILVTTPGKLVDHIYSTPGFSLKKLRYIVIDEADRVMDNFQNDWLNHLNNHLNVSGCPPLTIANLKTMPCRPQKLLFSATLSSDPEKLSELNLFQPKLFTSVVESNKQGADDHKFIGKYTTPSELKEYMVVCERSVKPLILFRLIEREQWKHILVFASTTQNVHNLAKLLSILGRKTQHRLKVAEINTAMPRPKRQQLIEDFTTGVINVLVSTDSLARGIDIPGVEYVINYDIPKFIKSYIHRVGRTGRAGQEGTAVSLLSHEQVELFTRMLKTAHKHEHIKQLEVNEDELEIYEDVYRIALQSLKKKIEKQQKIKHEEKIINSKIAIGKVKKINVNQQQTKLTKVKKKKRKQDRYS